MRTAEATVLIVHRDPGLREALSRRLQVSGHHPLTVGTGEAGIRVARDEVPAVAVIDLDLGDKPGLEVMREIRKHSPGTECVMLAERASQESAIEAVHLGAHSYLLEPHDVELLLLTIRRARERCEAEHQVLHDMGERIRELQCLCRTLQAIQTRETLDEVFEEVAALIPPGWRFPEIARAKIRFDGKEYLSEPFEETQWKLSAVFAAAGEPRGRVEVYYLEERPAAYEGPFLREERELLDGIAGALAQAIERKRGEQLLLGALAEAEARNAEVRTLLQELRQTQQQIVQQERLRALGKMTGGIAHNFNNALMPILSYTELLLANPAHLDDRALVSRYLAAMSASARDAATVVHRLQEFCGVPEQVETFAAVDLNEVVRRAIDLTRPRWKDEAQARSVTIEIETDLTAVRRAIGDERGLREVLINLILNAVDATPESGRITLRTRPEREYVALEVSDTGVGMSEEVRQRCLEPFFTTKAEEGAGMGLSMIHGIVSRHRGTIDIQSQEGEGTTFIIRLPAALGEPTAAPGESAVEVARILRVLVVDDEPMVRDVVAECLAADGHTPVTAEDGRKALGVFQEDRFDLVIVDRAMPEMSGDELAARIRRVAPNEPIIMLTGFGDVMAAAGEHPEDVDAVVAKPVTMKALRQAVARATASW
jgi:signal transduction histidine kinase/DNA-binding response OmpR family regulator